MVRLRTFQGREERAALSQSTACQIFGSRLLFSQFRSCRCWLQETLILVSVSDWSNSRAQFDKARRHGFPRTFSEDRKMQTPLRALIVDSEAPDARTVAGYAGDTSKRKSCRGGEFRSDRSVALRRLTPEPRLHGREDAERRWIRPLTQVEAASRPSFSSRPLTSSPSKRLKWMRWTICSNLCAQNGWRMLCSESSIRKSLRRQNDSPMTTRSSLVPMRRCASFSSLKLAALPRRETILASSSPTVRLRSSDAESRSGTRCCQNRSLSASNDRSSSTFKQSGKSSRKTAMKCRSRLKGSRSR